MVLYHSHEINIFAYLLLKFQSSSLLEDFYINLILKSDMMVLENEAAMPYMESSTMFFCFFFFLKSDLHNSII